MSDIIIKIEKLSKRYHLETSLVVLMFFVLLLDRNIPIPVNKTFTHISIALLMLGSLGLFFVSLCKSGIKWIPRSNILFFTTLLIILRAIPTLYYGLDIENYLRFLFPIYLGIVVFVLFQKTAFDCRAILNFSRKLFSLLLVFLFLHTISGQYFDLGYMIRQGRLNSLHAHSNAVAFVVFMAIFLNTKVFLLNKINTLVYIILSLMGFYILYLTDSRASLVLTLGGLLFFLILRLSLLKTSLMRLGILIFTTLIFMVGYGCKSELKRDYFKNFLKQENISNPSKIKIKRDGQFTTNGRFLLWTSCLGAIKDHPLGMVRKEYIIECQKHGRAPGVEVGAHNVIIQEGLMSGYLGMVIGLILYIMIGKYLIFALIRSYREKDIDLLSSIALCGSIALYSLVEISLFFGMYIQTIKKVPPDLR